jgi:hypothetical protein
MDQEQFFSVMFEMSGSDRQSVCMQKDDLIFTLKMTALAAAGLAIYVVVSFVRESGLFR